MNVKSQFIDWLSKANKYEYITPEKRLEYINKQLDFLGFDPFEIKDDLSDINSIIERIKLEVDHLRNENQEYNDFQKRSYNYAPAAFLGKDNYGEFLQTLSKSQDNFDFSRIYNKTEEKAIIESEDFFFQLGQDALFKWMDLNVSNSLKELLTKEKSNYRQLRELAETNNELNIVLDILYEIISYCDIHAKEKDKYNKYPDNRAMAEAYVRMNIWVERLILLKFDSKFTEFSSPSNAFNYLFDPINNSTILSENHRKMIAENLFKKEYQSENFNDDLISFFKSYDIKVKNPKNYTHLLMKLVYDIEKKWKEEVIGLMASDSTGWQAGYVEKLKNYNAGIIWNSKSPSGGADTLKQLRKILEEKQSFPLYYKSNNQVIYKADIFDFATREQFPSNNWESNYGPILDYYNNISDYVNGNLSAKILFLVKSLKPVSISLKNFKFYKSFSAPRQDNISPISNIIQELPQIQEDEINNTNYWLYQPGENARFWDEFYNNNIIGLGWDEIGDLNQYLTKDDITRALQYYYEPESSKKNDSTANYSFKELIKVGDIIIVKQGISKLLGYGIVTSDYYYDANRDEYQKCRMVNWKLKGEWPTDHKLARKTLTDITKYKSEHPNYQFYYERLMDMMQSNKVEEPITQYNKKPFPLNQILFGPPGTGKTYELSSKYFDQFTSQESNITRDEFLKNIISEKSWWEVLAFVLLDLKVAKVSEILNHELLQIKAGFSNSNTITPTIWGILQGHTIEACETVKVKKKTNPLIFSKKSDKTWEVLQEELEQQAPELLDEFSQIQNFQSSKDKVIKRYEFVTFHQSFTYEDFIEGIKPNLGDEDGEVTYEIVDGVFKKLALKAKENPSQDYAIFIDEINRGNVAAIFGELITLIEDDKREGNDNSLQVTLPYSKTKFSVPKNLYLIGTMNTADRSVEALDTALRRRFSFKEMAPKPELIASDGKLKDSNGIIEEIDLVKLLSTINNRIEKLIDKDHKIGHAYFMNIETKPQLVEAFKNKVIPLLEEYFFGDFGKISLILGSSFISKETDQEVTFAKSSEYDASIAADFLGRSVYQIKSEEDWDFKSIYE